jgi:hypothetical protein
MGKIEEAKFLLENIEDRTERSLQLAGLLATLFKIKGIVLVVVGQLAFDSYANAPSNTPELDMAVLSGKLLPRTELEIMREQLDAKGVLHHWNMAGISIRFQTDSTVLYPDLCRDFMTDHGVAKLAPVEEITAESILTGYYPVADWEAQTRARLLMINALTNAFQMDWTVLHQICHRPEFRIGEELAKMRLAAKKDVDAVGGTADQVGHASNAKPLSQVSLSGPMPPAARKLTGLEDL